jgi:hypothetical protein
MRNQLKLFSLCFDTLRFENVIGDMSSGVYNAAEKGFGTWKADLVLGNIWNEVDDALMFDVAEVIDEVL